MHTYTCKHCGKQVEVRLSCDVRMFCSKACYGKYLHDQRSYKIPIDPSERLCFHPKGLENLVAGICRQARDDYLKYPPGSYYRVDAEKFFRSDYFAILTELDGESILRDLAKEYNRQNRRKIPDGYGE